MRASLFSLVLLLAPLAIAGVAAAQPAPGARPLDRLLPEIRRAYPGRFLDAEGVTTNGSPHYHLKWLTPDGRVMWLDADARTGRVVQEAPGRDTFDRPAPSTDRPAPAPPAARYDANGPQGSYGRTAPQYRQQEQRPNGGQQGNGRSYGGQQFGNAGGGGRGGESRAGGSGGGGGGGDRGYGGQDRGGRR